MQHRNNRRKKAFAVGKGLMHWSVLLKKEFLIKSADPVSA